MNAYELADKLDWHWDNDCRSPAISKSADMLRQQADRIAELEKQGEPVAWWTGKYEDEGEDFMFPNTRQAHIDHPQSETHKFFSIPLYTTPQAKPLSNDEILEMTIWNKNLYELYAEMEKEDMIAFARAIEERHGIK